MTFPRTRQGVRNLDEVRQPVLPVSGGPAPRAQGKNIGDQERVLMALGGGALALFGLSRGSLCGLALAALGGTLAYHGLTGYCPLYRMAGVNTADDGSQSHSEVVYGRS
jgi:uncharacterized membrane protein